MSGWYASAWAETAAVADVYERAILTLMAHRADPDGTGAYPSVATMARFALCDEKTIERRLVALRRRKVIAYGDQRQAEHIDKRYRSKVYDLLIPYDWYSAAQMEEVNRHRVHRGLPPLDPSDRPPLQPPTRARKPRSDKGVTRTPAKTEQPPRSAGMPKDQGGLQDPPAGDGPEPGSGGTTSPLQGGLQVPSRGDYKTPNTSQGNSPVKRQGGPPPLNPPTPAADAAGTNNAGNSASVVATESKYRRNQLHARARTKAGPAACAAMDQHLDISVRELEQIISEADPVLTPTQAAGRAAVLWAFELKARRQPASRPRPIGLNPTVTRHTPA